MIALHTHQSPGLILPALLRAQGNSLYGGAGRLVGAGKQAELTDTTISKAANVRQADLWPASMIVSDP